MARSNIQLEEKLNVLLKEYAKGKIRLPTVEKELDLLKKEIRKKPTGRRKDFMLITRYEAIFQSLQNKKIVIKKSNSLSKKPKNLKNKTKK